MVLVSQYFLCFLFRMRCPFSQQFAVESGKLSAWGLSVSRWLSLFNHVLQSVPLAWIFQVAGLLEGSENLEGSQEPMAIL